MDRVVAQGSGFTRPRMIAAGVILAVLIGVAFAVPTIRRWSRADRAVDASTLSFGVVSRGDLVRDVSVQGRVVAALHPTLISPAQGVVTLRTKAGSVVRKGDVLAIVDSPELRSSLEQSKAQLLSFRTDFERGKIAGSQSEARLRQAVSIAQVRLDAAKRGLHRADLLRTAGILSGPDYERAQDDVHVALQEHISILVLAVKVPAFDDARADREAVGEHDRIGMVVPPRVEELGDRPAQVRVRGDVADRHAVGQPPHRRAVARHRLAIARGRGEHSSEQGVGR